jgi:spore maturation protein CgeB
MGYETLSFQYGVKYSHRKGKLAFTYNKSQLLLDNLLWNTPYHERAVQKALQKAIAGKAIILTIVTHDFLKPEEVQLLKSTTQAPVVLWFPDALVNMGRHMFLNAPFDFLFFKDPFLVRRLQADFPLKSVYYLPECCNPQVHRIYEPQPGDMEKYACDITTAGNLYANRVAFFEQLADMNLDIRIWGNAGSRWMKLDRIKSYLRNEYIMEQKKGMAFLLSKIVLNNLHPGEVAGINCRAFEIPAMGGFQMINWRNGLDDLFEPGKEVVAFNSFSDLKEKIRYYLSNEQERKRVAENAYKKVHQEHTYANRLAILRDTVLGNLRGYKLPDNQETGVSNKN